MKRVFGGLALLVFASCGGSNRFVTPCSPPPAQPDEIPVTIEATARLNPDTEGNPLPTEIRIYQLSDVVTMDRANFEEVWQNAAETLGESLLEEETITIYPGSSQTLRIQTNPELRAIAAMAIVREPTGRSWRAIATLPSPPAASGEPQFPPCPPPPPAPSVNFRADGYRVERVQSAIQ